MQSRMLMAALEAVHTECFCHRSDKLLLREWHSNIPNLPGEGKGCTVGSHGLAFLLQQSQYIPPLQAVCQLLTECAFNSPFARLFL